MPELGDLLSRLLAHEVQFVLVGGFAAVAHGSPLMTIDIDICCDLGRENLHRIHTAVADLHPVHRMTPSRLAFDPESLGPGAIRNLYLDTDWGPLDCLGEILGVGDFDVVLRRSLSIMVFGRECRLLTIDALIEAKRAMGRPRDLETIRYLEAIRSHERDG